MIKLIIYKNNIKLITTYYLNLKVYKLAEKLILF